MNLFHPSTARSGFTANSPFLCIAGIATLLCAAPVFLRAQSDDFNDGTDLPEWTRYSPLGVLGVPGVFSFPNGGYRIQTTVPTGMANNPPRAGSLRTNVYTDFYAAVDLVNWKDDTRQAFGLLAHISTPGLGTTTGYAFTYERGSGVTPTSGDTDISRITGEAPTGLASGGAVHLDPAKDYRFVFVGRNSFPGVTLEGRIYELPNTLTPILTTSASDAIPYLSGTCGLVIYDNSGGGGVCDATFDNYFVTEIEPPRITLTDQGFNSLKISWPSSATGFKLQTSPILPATTWTDYPEPPTDDEMGSFFVSVDTSIGDKFYRLVKP